jgi:LPS O-antigen subunit length determinant protein (WzzB/FepE family)
MKEEKKYTFNLSSLELIAFAWKKRIPLIIVSVIAIIVSVIVSYQITPLFKSQVVLFAEPDASIAKYLFSYNYVGRKGMLSFGEEEETEQLLQVLNSNQIRDRIIEKYDLMNHYEIDTSHRYKHTLVYKAYKGHVKFNRTKYLSVLITVLDKDPVIAANISNDIADLVDTIMNDITRERALIGFELVEEQLKELGDKIRVCEDSLSVLNKLGIGHYESQSERLIEAYGFALKDGNMEGAKRLEKELANLSKYGSAYVSIRDRNNFYKQQMYVLNTKYVEAKVEAEQAVPHKYVVDYAYPAEKKSYPKKSIIVLTSTIAAFIFALFILMAVDIIKRNKSKV